MFIECMTPFIECRKSLVLFYQELSVCMAISIKWCQFWCKWCQEKSLNVLKKILDMSMVNFVLNDTSDSMYYAISTYFIIRFMNFVISCYFWKANFENLDLL